MFYWPEFDWDDDNISHIARHNVETWEAEEALTDPAGVGKGAHSGVRAMIGKTVDGRLLVVIYVPKDDKLRVITARDASARERGIYRRRSR